MSYPFWRLTFVAGDPRLAMSAFRSQRVWLIWFSNEIWRCGCRLLINRMTLTSNLFFTLPSAKAGGNHFLGELRCFVFYSAVPNGILCFFSLIRSPELGLTYLHSYIDTSIHSSVRMYIRTPSKHETGSSGKFLTRLRRGLTPKSGESIHQWWAC